MGTWYKNGNDSSVRPMDVDTTSSKRWNYVRKDFRLVAARTADGQTVPEHWEWQEMKVQKEVLEIYNQASENKDNVDLLTECVLEMSEILYGE